MFSISTNNVRATSSLWNTDGERKRGKLTENTQKKRKKNIKKIIFL